MTLDEIAREVEDVSGRAAVIVSQAFVIGVGVDQCQESLFEIGGVLLIADLMFAQMADEQ